MGHVTGLGGVFVRTRDAARLRDWYAERLGVPMQDFGAQFHWRLVDRPEALGYSVWGVFAEPADYFAPSTRPFMVNLRVDDLDSLLESLRQAGEQVDERVEEGEFGRFGWVMDPDGTRLELWEPPDADPALAVDEIAGALTAFLAAVDAGDADALERCLDPDASMYFPFADTPGLAEGRDAITARFARLFAAWRRRGRVPPYVGFEPAHMRVRPAGHGHALATFTVGIDGAAGRRSALLRRSVETWRILHLHASNLEPRGDGG